MVTKELAAMAVDLRALAHPARLCIMQGLLERERACVSDIEECLCISQSGVSQHLQRLREAKLVCAQRCKNKIYYCINPAAKPWVACMFAGWQPREGKKHREKKKES